MQLLYLNSNKMGDGDAKLGEQLLLAFLKKLLKQTDKIDAIVCVNSGAYLTTKNNETVSVLSEFEKNGAVISTCGTCLDFYSIRENLQVGNVGSMELLVNLMSKAKKVIKP